MLGRTCWTLWCLKYLSVSTETCEVSHVQEVEMCAEVWIVVLKGDVKRRGFVAAAGRRAGTRSQASSLGHLPSLAMTNTVHPVVSTQAGEGQESCNLCMLMESQRPLVDEV